MLTMLTMLTQQPGLSANRRCPKCYTIDLGGNAMKFRSSSIRAKPGTLMLANLGDWCRTKLVPKNTRLTPKSRWFVKWWMAG